MTEPFWEQREQVQRFAGREPDHRLARLVDRFANPSAVRVLDLGCAGGRNTVFLARRGFEVHALDASRAMVRETRRRLAEVLGAARADLRVNPGSMDDLSAFATGSIDLLVALGVHHNARTPDEWDRTLGEAARVLARGGLALVSNFTPRTEPEGAPLVRVSPHLHVYAGFSSGHSTLMEAPLLDAEMGRFGFRPWTPTETVLVETHPGRRVSANALYLKA